MYFFKISEPAHSWHSPILPLHVVHVKTKVCNHSIGRYSRYSLTSHVGNYKLELSFHIYHNNIRSFLLLPFFLCSSLINQRSQSLHKSKNLQLTTPTFTCVESFSVHTFPHLSQIFESMFPPYTLKSARSCPVGESFLKNGEITRPEGEARFKGIFPCLRDS